MTAARTYTIRKAQDRPVRPAFLDDLNPAQRKAATAPDGPVLIIAGAGTGKTRTLVYRMAWLISRGVPPDRILLLTFTNRAAREMLARAEGLLGSAAGRLWGGTFHHAGNRLLREHATALGYRPGYTILDPEDAKSVMRGCVTEMGLGGSGRKRRLPRPDSLLRTFSRAVNTGEPLADLFTRRHPNYIGMTDLAEEACRLFVERKVELNALDFDDLLLGWRMLLEHPEVGPVVRGRFQHVLVDEYQDTNWLQGDLVDRMAAAHENVTVVGDDCQAIYSFRGASFENILGFPDRYPQTKTFRLEDNYRSTPQILALANRSISRNERQFEKTLRAVRGAGELPGVFPCADEAQQAAFVADQVKRFEEEDVPLSDVAVLYRAHRHAVALEVELKRRGIEYEVRSGVRFFERAHIKDVICWLKTLHNPDDELALRRVLLLQPGIGDAAVARILAARKEGRSPELRGRSSSAWERMQTLLGRMRTAPVGDALRMVLDGGYKEHLEDRYPDHRERTEDVRSLAEFAGSCGGVEDFLDKVSGLTEVVGQGFREGRRTEDDAGERLVLSTVHQAKGLEWQAVFVLGLADGLFPLPWVVKSERELEEERRLFYVAVTRARTELMLVYPVFGTGGMDRAVVQTESRFLRELQGSPSVYETWKVEYEG